VVLKSASRRERGDRRHDLREEDRPLDYVRVSGEISRAKAVVDWWNEDHPQRHVPWEWVEEMLLAKHRWHSLARQRSGKALDHYARYQEFSKKLPRPLVDQIFQGR
jgi:hypothetical protein